jgi:hypothetical protein
MNRMGWAALAVVGLTACEILPERIASDAERARSAAGAPVIPAVVPLVRNQEPVVLPRTNTPVVVAAPANIESMERVVEVPVALSPPVLLPALPTMEVTELLAPAALIPSPEVSEARPEIKPEISPTLEEDVITLRFAWPYRVRSRMLMTLDSPDNSLGSIRADYQFQADRSGNQYQMQLQPKKISGQRSQAALLEAYVAELAGGAPQWQVHSSGLYRGLRGAEKQRRIGLKMLGKLNRLVASISSERSSTLENALTAPLLERHLSRYWNEGVGRWANLRLQRGRDYPMRYLDGPEKTPTLATARFEQRVLCPDQIGGEPRCVELHLTTRHENDDGWQRELRLITQPQNLIDYRREITVREQGQVWRLTLDRLPS